MSMKREIKPCRSCEHGELEVFLDLGVTPLADRFVAHHQLQAVEPHFPLRVGFCPNCSLVQILDSVSPQMLFCEEYPYFSSFSPQLLDHSRQNVLERILDSGLGPESLVVEIASNDGYLLKNYLQHGIEVLGIDPAQGPAQSAIRQGIPTLQTFFTKQLAQELAQSGKRADVIHANNVLAHVPDPNGFVQGIGLLLKPDGVAVIEVPYLRNLIDQCEFDTIYHEHLCYFSVGALDRLFTRNGLWLNDIDQLSIHGGSLRLFVQKHPGSRERVDRMLQSEHTMGLDTALYYQGFAQRVENVKQEVNTLLSQLKADGATIAAYGAAAKGTTMINYVGLGVDYLDFVADRNTYKHGKFMPGLHIPIVGAEEVLKRMPHYLLVLAWNFAEEIARQQQEYLKRGGKLIIPLPHPHIVDERGVSEPAW
jgi:SAM-dependent methyltransferase